jgi:hypothetical protein
MKMIFKKKPTLKFKLKEKPKIKVTPKAKTRFGREKYTA